MKEIVDEQEKLSWISVSPDAPYFVTEKGENWAPVGQNDAVTWPDFAGLFQRRDIAGVERHLEFLANHGVSCLRMMLEYCQTENRYLERPVGRFQPHMVQLWDDLFKLCEKYRIRILLTPFDTFWMARRWKFHPYNKLSGGPCKAKTQWLTCPETLKAIKNRFTFAVERWGGSGVLFAWDLWNEINPANAGRKTDGFYSFIEQIGDHVREKEMQLYGKTHPQTVSIFAPLMLKYDVTDAIFRHPKLDFGSTHFYEEKTINYPRNTFDAALTTGKMVREVMHHLPPERPFFDSEHGPIDYFSKRRKSLPEAFDDQYFLNMQWAHLASGGAGGGMRWPYRHPHVLTHGMRRAQKNLTDFMSVIDWKVFKRENLNEEILSSDPEIQVFACGDSSQTIVWLLQKNRKPSSVVRTLKVMSLTISFPNLKIGKYKVHLWDTILGELEVFDHESEAPEMKIGLKFPQNNLALAVVKVD